MTKAPEKTRRTERLAFRYEPEKADVIRKMADERGLPYSILLRRKADELVEQYESEAAS